MKQFFVIMGIPKAQGRPRFARMGKFVKTYDPKESRVYKDNVAAQVVAQKPKYIENDAIRIAVTFFLPRPKSLKKSITEHVKKPDIDNLVKALLDSLKGIVWRDDSQIVYMSANKVYTTNHPKIDLMVESYSTEGIK